MIGTEKYNKIYKYTESKKKKAQTPQSPHNANAPAIQVAYNIQSPYKNSNSLPKSQSAQYLHNGQVHTTQFTIGQSTTNNTTNTRPQSMSSHKKQSNLPIPNKSKKPPKKGSYSGSHPLSNIKIYTNININQSHKIVVTIIKHFHHHHHQIINHQSP